MRSLHYCHAYNISDPLNLDNYYDSASAPDLSSIDLETLLFSPNDVKEIRHNMALLIAHTMKKCVPYFAKYAKRLEKQITHKFCDEMFKSSVVVCWYMYSEYHYSYIHVLKVPLCICLYNM